MINLISSEIGYAVEHTTPLFLRLPPLLCPPPRGPAAGRRRGLPRLPPQICSSSPRDCRASAATPSSAAPSPHVLLPAGLQRCLGSKGCLSCRTSASRSPFAFASQSSCARSACESSITATSDYEAAESKGTTPATGTLEGKLAFQLIASDDLWRGTCLSSWVRVVVVVVESST